MVMRPYMSYTYYATSLREQTGDIITFTQFEEGNLLSETHYLWSETRDNTESGNEYDENPTLAPLINEKEIDVISSGDESDDESISTEIL